MLTERADRINALVTGWMIPVMKRTDPITGDVLNGLGPADFGRVRAGHGCPRCLAKFNTYLAVCPACDYQRDIMSDIEEAPQHWVDHLADRHSEDQQGGSPVSFDEFMGEVLADRDIEHRKLQVPRRQGKAERSSERRWRTRKERIRKGKVKEGHKARKKKE